MTESGPLHDYSRSRAVLIGCSDYTHLPEIKSAGNSLDRMEGLLLGAQCGWPADRVTVLRDETRRGTLPDRLVKLFADVTDIALVYFVGHGQVYEDQLCLALAESPGEGGPRQVTVGLPFVDVRFALRACEARNKIVILDCCYSGRAIQGPGTMGVRGLMAMTADTGAFTMAASGAYNTASFELDSDEDSAQTHFTKYLVDVIEQGLPDQHEGIKLGPLFDATAEALMRDGLPRPTCSARHQGGHFVLARNPANGRLPHPAPPGHGRGDPKQESADSVRQNRDNIARLLDEPESAGAVVALLYNEPDGSEPGDRDLAVDIDRQARHRFDDPVMFARYRAGIDEQAAQVGGEILGDWVIEDPVPAVAARIAAIRSGDRESSLAWRPEAAMRLVSAFAMARTAEELLDQTAECFDPLDLLTILAIAALRRPIEHAADIAIRQWRKEPANKDGTRPVADGIVHDVACQRTAAEVAVFVQKCQAVESLELSKRTLTMFTARGSGRTNLDKALLYLALRDTGSLATLAAQFLESTLLGMGDGWEPLAAGGPSELHDFAGALNHLSPSESILEEWFDQARGKTADNEQVLKTVISKLIVAEPSDGAQRLARYVAGTWPGDDVADVCGLLLNSAPDASAAVRGHAGGRKDPLFLADLIIAWHRTPILRESLPVLLADIVGRGGDHASGPRPKNDIDLIDQRLANKHAPAECRRLLRAAAAAHVEGRTGADVAELLHDVQNPRSRRRVARTVAEAFARGLLARSVDEDAMRFDASATQFADYLKTLSNRKDGDSAYWARSQLADPAELSKDTAVHMVKNVCEIAARLYAVDLGPDGFDLLERCLENEQRIQDADVAYTVQWLGRLTAMPKDSRLELLGSTIGRWSENDRRKNAVQVLQSLGLDDDATAVIQALR